MMQELPFAVALIVTSYCLGAVPFGYLIAWWVKGIDIREHGSGNIGATNVGRVLGAQWFLLVFILDFAKGFLPTMLPTFLVLDTSFLSYSGYQVIFGACAFLGHLFPIFLGFRGGKGVATGLGVVFALDYIAAGITLVFWLSSFLVFRYVSLSSVLAALVLPVAHWFTYTAVHSETWITIFFVAATGAVILKHIPNVKRLVAGTEPKVLWRKKSSS